MNAVFTVYSLVAWSKNWPAWHSLLHSLEVWVFWNCTSVPPWRCISYRYHLVNTTLPIYTVGSSLVSLAGCPSHRRCSVRHKQGHARSWLGWKAGSCILFWYSKMIHTFSNIHFSLVILLTMMSKAGSIKDTGLGPGCVGLRIWFCLPAQVHSLLSRYPVRCRFPRRENNVITPIEQGRPPITYPTRMAGRNH